MSTVKIQTVKSVVVRKLIGHVAIIVAHGEVPTLGYKHPQLIPYIYVHPPTDGIYDFDFVVEPPTGPAGEVIVEKVAMEEWIVPHGAKGVRIHGQKNSVEAKL